MRIKLDSPFYIGEISDLINPSSIPPSVRNKIITHVSTDSRDCKAGDLFFAIKGKRYDGNDYVLMARSLGCICVADTSEHAHIRVRDSSDALLQLAGFYRLRAKSLKACIAVTGSVGKSSTKEFLKKILSADKRTHASIGNYNNEIGIAHTVLSMPRETEYLICEMGMNHSGEISRLSKCVRPDISVITNVGTSHIGNLGSREAIAKAKTEITDGMNGGTTLIPYNEPLLRGIPRSMTVGYNVAPSLSNFTLCKDGASRYNYVFPDGILCDLRIPISQEHLLMNVSTCIAASLILNIGEKRIRDGLSVINDTDLRQRFIQLSDFTVFDDSYNASYESIRADLKYLLNKFGNNPIGAFIGDIQELGDATEDIHRKIGRLASELRLSSLYLIGKYSEYIAKGATESGFDASRIFINESLDNHSLSIRQIYDNHLKNEIILFKGSHSAELYKIADTMAENERIKNDR